MKTITRSSSLQSFFFNNLLTFLLLLSIIVGPFVLTPSFAAISGPSRETRRNNVILLMLDGVRWQEFFHGADPLLSGSGSGGDFNEGLFPHLFSRLSYTTGVVFGDRMVGETMTVSNPHNVSLPGYQSLFAGGPQPCLDNDCGRIQVETFPERLVRELKLDKKQVAVIASWNKIPLAVEHVEGTLFVNASKTSLKDGLNDSELKQINKLQKTDLPPWGSGRYDRYTMAHALRYLRLHQPRFLFISLLDPDKWAHKKDYPNYLNSLRQSDEWIEALLQTLKSLGDYGRSTTLIVTTDHGRGLGEKWGSHSAKLPESQYVWLYAHSNSHALRPIPRERKIAHKDLRPTIEALFNLKPIQCAECGHPIKELLPERLWDF